MRKAILLVITASLIGSCEPSSKDSTGSHKLAQHCIEKVIASDDSLGLVRNHACETISLSETIKQYTDNLAQLDFSGCPDDFSEAFESHRQSWLDLRAVTNDYPVLRGEMHVLFEQLEQSPDSAQFNRLVDNIWATWANVESAMKPAE